MTNTLTDERVTAMLKAIADPTRRHILRLLRERKGCCAIGEREGLCACDIESCVRLAQPTVSHHMAILRAAGLVEAEKVGQWMWYRRNERAVREMGRIVSSF